MGICIRTCLSSENTPRLKNYGDSQSDVYRVAVLVPSNPRATPLLGFLHLDLLCLQDGAQQYGRKRSGRKGRQSSVIPVLCPRISAFQHQLKSPRSLSVLCSRERPSTLTPAPDPGLWPWQLYLWNTPVARHCLGRHLEHLIMAAGFNIHPAFRRDDAKLQWMISTYSLTKLLFYGLVYKPVSRKLCLVPPRLYAATVLGAPNLFLLWGPPIVETTFVDPFQAIAYVKGRRRRRTADGFDD